MSETDIDGNSTALFLLKAIRIDAGQSLDQCGFAMIDMPGSANNDRLHGNRQV